MIYRLCRYSVRQLQAQTPKENRRSCLHSFCSSLSLSLHFYYYSVVEKAYAQSYMSKTWIKKLGSERFDPASLRDQKIWCLSESSVQRRQMMSLSEVTLKALHPTETSRLVPIKHIECQRWMSVDFFRDESSPEVVELIYKTWVSPQETCSTVFESFYRTCLALTSHEHWITSTAGQITVQSSGGQYYNWERYQKT